MMINAPWLATARAEIGVREKVGPAINPRITEYYNAAGSLRAKDDAVPWCSAFVHWVFAQHGIRGTGSLAARSWLKWGKPSPCTVGALAILPRGTSSWQGHVTFVTRVMGDRFMGLGGNQRDAVCELPYKVGTALGFRVPTTMVRSNTARSAMAGGAATLMGVVASSAEDIGFVADSMSTYLDWLQYVSAAAALVGVCATIWFRWKATRTDDDDDDKLEA